MLIYVVIVTYGSNNLYIYMANTNTNKEHIEATPEVAAMFNMGQSTTEVKPVDHTAVSPQNLPIIDAESSQVPDSVSAVSELDFTDLSDMEKTEIHEDEIQPIEDALNDTAVDNKTRVLHIAKSVAPYLGIFIVGLFLYQYFFSGFSINSFLPDNSGDTAQESTVESNGEINERLTALKKEKAGEYAAWIRQFFYEVTDPAIVDMETDISGNGLSNFEKFMLNLNPKAYDTLGLGQPDGQTVMDGNNPWTGKPLTENQKKIVELYFDQQLISNRLAAGSLKLSQNNIANASANPNSNGYQNPSNYSFVDGTGQPSGTNSAGSGSPEGSQSGNSFAVNTASNNAQVAGAYTNQPQQILGTGGNVGGSAGSGATSTGQGNALRSLDVNTDIAGELNIPSNNIKAPLTFTKDTRHFETDLTKGVVHYPGTALPGSVGTAYISGHSSGYAWQRNAYKNIFRGLNNVKDGTSFTITVTLKDSRKATIHYVVQNRQEFAPNDQAQFVQTAEARVALSTCWPLDTTQRRLVLFAKQTQVSF